MLSQFVQLEKAAKNLCQKNILGAFHGIILQMGKHELKLLISLGELFLFLD